MCRGALHCALYARWPSPPLTLQGARWRAGRGARLRALALRELDLEVCILGGGDTGEGAVVRDRGGWRGDEGSSVRHNEAVWGGGSYSLGQSSAETDPITRVTNTVQVTRTLTLRDSQQHCTCYRSQVSNYW